MGEGLPGVVPVICEPCRIAWHDNCENNEHPAERVGVRPEEGLWCNCQHKPRSGPLTVQSMTFTPVLNMEEQS